jgi:hypothetical protein
VLSKFSKTENEEESLTPANTDPTPDQTLSISAETIREDVVVVAHKHRDANDEECEEIYDDDSESRESSDEEDDVFKSIDDQGTRLQCFAHSIQLCVKCAMKNDSHATNVLNSLRSVVTFFTKSTFWRSRLRDSAGKDLIKPSLTRLNTYFYVLQRFLSVSSA